MSLKETKERYMGGRCEGRKGMENCAIIYNNIKEKKQFKKFKYPT